MGNSVALVVEDDKNTSLAYSRMFETMGFSVHLAHSLNQARSHVEALKPSVVLLDMGLPDGSGLDLLKRYARKTGPKPQFVVVTGTPSQDMAVDCLRADADDFLSKPVSLKKLRGSVGQLLAKRQSVQGNGDTVAEQSTFDVPTYQPEQTVVLKGNSMCAHQLREAVNCCAKSALNTIITGPSGVDKSAIAYALHLQSQAKGNFICVFGSDLAPPVFPTDSHGSAQSDTQTVIQQLPSLLKAAQGGTLVVCDITSMPLTEQANLCSQLRGLGPNASNNRSSTHTKIVATIHDDWETAVAEGRLHQELYHRIAEFVIKVPSLKERSKDIPEMANAILHRLNQSNKVAKRLSPGSLERLENYTWPGNVRELNNVIAQSFSAKSATINITHDLTPSGNRLEQEQYCVDSLVGKTFWETEKALLFATLDSVNGDKATAAEMLGISLKTLYNRLNAYS